MKLSSSILLALTGACSSSASSTGGPWGPDDAGSADVGPFEAASGCSSTSACAPSPVGSQQCVTTVDLTLVDATGAPAAGVPVFVCGTNLCSVPVKSSPTGAVSLALCHTYSAPALKIFDDPAWSPLAAILSGDGPSFTLGTLTLAALPPSGMPMQDGTSVVTSGGVSLSMVGAKLTFDFEHASPDAREFRAVAIDPAHLPPSLAGAADAAWALAPLNTRIAPAAALSLPNPQNWAPGTAVDVLLDGTDSSTTTPAAPWGTWGPLGSATVSGDGQRIEFPAGAGGLPVVAMVGVRRH